MPSTCTTDTPLLSAVVRAEAFADESGLPQTVYRNGESGGWWHTNALAPLLLKSQVYFTALPTRYFR